MVTNEPVSQLEISSEPATETPKGIQKSIPPFHKTEPTENSESKELKKLLDAVNASETVPTLPADPQIPLSPPPTPSALSVPEAAQ